MTKFEDLLSKTEALIIGEARLKEIDQELINLGKERSVLAAGLTAGREKLKNLVDTI